MITEMDSSEISKLNLPNISIEAHEIGDSLINLTKDDLLVLKKYFPSEKGCFPGQEVLAKFIHIGLKKRSERATKYVAEARDIFTKAVNPKDWQEAKDLLRKALKEDNSNEDAYEALGVILGREGKYQEAVDVMKKLEKLNPASIMAKTNLSIFYMRLGDKETAEEYKAKATIAQFEDTLKS